MMKRVRSYSVICSFQEAAPTLQEKMRVLLQNAVKERESLWTLRK